MHEREKSDPAIGAGKPANEAAPAAEEWVEQRAGAKGNASGLRTLRTQSRESVSQALDRVRTKAREGKTEKFTALLHHINDELLRDSFYAIQRKAAPGVDGVLWKDYAADLEQNLSDLLDRIHRGAYRALPSRRVYIPKADGRQRPLAVAALEDKIVQRAAATVLEAIYEEDFLGFSYGFRPGRGPHDALDALAVAIGTRKVNYILDADIQSFFDRVSHEWLVRFLEHRIADKRMLRLILKWLTVGVLEDGFVVPGEVGTGQGSVISPLLANVYLHYTFDLWAEQWRRREAKGDMIIIRYADDIVVGFQHEADAKRFWDDMERRLAKFALTLHPEKTRLIEFGRYAAEHRARRGLGKPETFNFLGLRHICGVTRRGKFLLRRHTRADRMRAKLKEIKVELMRRRHQPIPAQGRWLGQVVGGFFGYHAVPTNAAALSAFSYHVTVRWQRALRRRSQKDRLTSARMDQLAADFLPKPLIRHPWPSARFAATHPR
jgi:RNA-directed DNA polymerase